MLYQYLIYTSNQFLVSSLATMLKTNKAKGLIEDRQIEIFLNQHVFNPKAAKSVFRFLFRLQKLVYKLDSYGETNWKLDRNSIAKKWNTIFEFILKSGFSEIETEQLLETMNSYMQVEIRMRSNDLPNKIPISDYYELKICDVQLQREIIKRKSNYIHNSEYYRLWQLIDIVSEILDDINDMEEDINDYNCNRIIISNHFSSASVIKNAYLNYLNNLRDEFESLIHTQSNPIKTVLVEIFNAKFTDYNSKLKELDLSKYQSKIITQLDTENSQFNYLSKVIHYFDS